MAFKRVVEIALGQQYNVGEKPTVILYTYINRHAGTPEKTVKTKQRRCSTPSHMVVIIYYYIGYKYKVTTWYLRLHYTRLFPDPRFLLFVLQNIAGYKNAVECLLQ